MMLTSLFPEVDDAKVKRVGISCKCVLTDGLLVSINGLIVLCYPSYSAYIQHRELFYILSAHG